VRVWETSHTTAPRAIAVSQVGNAFGVFLSSSADDPSPLGVGGRVTGTWRPFARPAVVTLTRVSGPSVPGSAVGAVDGLAAPFNPNRSGHLSGLV
jgi:hypothetical protein